MNKATRLSAALLSLLLVVSLSGCSSLFVKSDNLVFVGGSSSSQTDAGLNAQIKITEFSEVYSGTLLDYDANGPKALCVTREISPMDASVSYSLVYYDGNLAYQMTSSDIPITEGAIDAQTGDVYYKESNTSASVASLYMIDSERNTKTKITNDIPSSLLSFALASDGTLMYSDRDGIYIYSGGESSKVASLDEQCSVKKIIYLKNRGVALMIINVPQGSNILYSVSDTDYVMNAVDVNVSDFSATDASSLVAYIKTTTTGKKQLYTYNLDTSARSFLFSGDIEKISLSPSGTYIAYATEMTSQSTTQSVWLVNSKNDVPVQLTANTAVNGGGLFWEADEKKILFSTSKSVATDTNPVYAVYRLTFILEYLKEQK